MNTTESRHRLPLKGRGLIRFIRIKARIHSLGTAQIRQSRHLETL